MEEEIDFSAELENYLDQHDYDMPKPGDIRKGIILDISDRGAIIGLGLKRDGFVPADDLNKLSPEEVENLEVDSEVPVYIVDTGKHDSLQVSLHRALINEDWIKAEELMGEKSVVEAEVVGYNRGGALVDYGRLRGFIPLSQLAAFKPGMKDRDKQRMLSKLRGEMLPLKIIEVDRKRRRLVMSNREAQKQWDSARRAERIQEIQPGDVLTGTISSLRNFGAFVDIGDSLEGLVHVSELAWHRIDHPEEVVSIGEEVEVYVLKVDPKEQRISLSRKRMLKDPWSLVEEKYKVNELVEGVVTRIVNYGAFVELEPGIEGLLHSSKMVRGSDTADPNKVIQVGENHLLRIINIDSDRQRIALSLRAVTPKEQIAWMMRETDMDLPESGDSADMAEESEAVAETVEAAAEVVEETTADATEAAAETVAEVAEEMVADAADAVEETTEAVAEVAEAVVEETTEAAEEAVEAVEAVVDTAVGMAEEATEAVAEVAETVEETASEAVEDAAEAIAEVAEAAEETASEVVEDAAETVSEVAQVDATTESESGESASDDADSSPENDENEESEIASSDESGEEEASDAANA